jgi:hypothetical protein
LEVGSGNIDILLFEIADEFHIVMFDDGWADFTVQPILTTNRIVYHPIHCVEILLRFVIWMTRSIGHPPHSSASPVELRLRVGPRALSGKKK